MRSFMIASSPSMQSSYLVKHHGDPVAATPRHIASLDRASGYDEASTNLPVAPIRAPA
jgi:hypothetical protein